MKLNACYARLQRPKDQLIVTGVNPVNMLHHPAVAIVKIANLANILIREIWDLVHHVQKVSTPTINLPKTIKSEKIVVKVVPEEVTVIKKTKKPKKNVKIVPLVDTLIVLVWTSWVIANCVFVVNIPMKLATRRTATV
jgi:hypothetical protein